MTAIKSISNEHGYYKKFLQHWPPSRGLPRKSLERRGGDCLGWLNWLEVISYQCENLLISKYEGAPSEHTNQFILRENLKLFL